MKINRRLEPERVASDTYVIRQLFGEGIAPAAVYVNSMVIAGAEPVIVDTGPAVARDDWMADVFSIVDPADVRWVFLSHDDHDHVGNLPQVLDLCPNATLVTNMFTIERLASEYLLPLHRTRIVNDGDRFTAGDRELLAVVPPTFDSPTTRGLLDTRTGVYWGVDSFGTPVPSEITDVAELDRDVYRAGFLQMNRLLSPWHRWLDGAKYGSHLARVRSLRSSVVASAHGPALKGDQIGTALDLLAQLPDLPAAPVPGQEVLEALVAFITSPPEQQAA
ncbi:MAG: MBL fold metallo-hydrolase [Actinomycetota bacterium]|nr:MBL fold metallo-hydrolase [Actinomycetota bacterium]